MSEIRPDPGASGRYLLSGELSFETVPALLEDGAAMLEQGTAAIDLDLREVTRADSAGLALLIEWMRVAHRRHRNIVFRNLPAQMLTMARVSSLDRILPIEQ